MANKHTIIRLVLLAFCYFLLANLSNVLFAPSCTFFTVRLAPAFGLIATLIYGLPVLLAVFIGEFFYFYSQYHTEIPILSSLALAIIAVFYTYLGTRLIHRYIDPPYQLSRALDCYKFILIAGFAASLIPSLLAVFNIALFDAATQQSYWLLTTHWWLGQALGVLIISPIVFCFLNKPVTIWQSRIPLVPVLMLSLLILIVVIYAYVSIKEKERLESILKHDALAISSAIKLKVSSYEESLYSIKNLFEHASGVDPQEFELLSNKIKSRQPTISAFSYHQLVQAYERHAFESKMREIYTDNFQITERNAAGQLVRAGDREMYTPITTRHIYDKDAVIMGFDTSTSSYSKLARQQTVATDKVTISRALTLTSTTGNNKSVVFYLPVETHGNFSGFVTLSVYINQAIESVIKVINLENMSLQIWDGEPAENNTIYLTNTIKHKNHSGLKRIGQIEFLPHSWTYELIPDPSYSSQIITSQLLTTLFCILISTILLIRLMEFTGSKHELGRRVSESEARFKGAFINTPIGMAISSLDHRIIDANPSLCAMLGYDKEELEGKCYVDFTHAEDINISINQHNKLVAKEIDHYAIEKRYIHKKGHIIWVLLSVSMTCDDEGTPLHGIAQIQNITQQKEHAHELNYLANHDPLTELVNRREFERRADRLLSTIKRDKTQHALCFMDLDQFKIINDTCGHSAGDEMLRQISAVLQKVIRHSDTLARLGGDEFGVLMEHCSLEDAQRVCRSILETIQDFHFSWQENSFKVGVSMGLASITKETLSLSELMKNVDAACYLAKEQGRNRVHVYSIEDIEIAQRHGEMQWVTRVDKALDENRFSLYGQPIVCLDGKAFNHYEILIRMIDEKGNVVQPNAFLPAAERYNLISKVDRWVVENTLTFLSSNVAYQKQIDLFSINISGQSLTDEGILDFIIEQFEKNDLKPSKICFEITETAAIANMTSAIKFITRLKTLGCRFSLDDFGSGLSSFAYLKNLPVDFLKIDGVFVKDIAQDPIDHAFVKSINEIGQVMGMRTIAEFVENDEIKNMLKEIGVNYAQGYGIGKPQAINEFFQKSQLKSAL